MLQDTTNVSVTSGNHDEETSDIADAAFGEKIPDSEYLTGWKLHLTILFRLLLALFAVQMEATIVSTSVIAITNELRGFSMSSWIFTGFLLTYSGFVIIWAKLSDIYGRKPLLLASLFIFTAFSGGCGAAQTLTQLIVCRCLQGLGASGVYSLVIIIFFEMVPPHAFPKYTAIVTMSITMSTTFGPLIGGAINNHTTWRWVFLLNCPLGALSLLGLIILMPTVFPNQRYLAQLSNNPPPSKFSFQSLNRVDGLGAMLLLGASVLLITALQQAADGKSFAAAVVLPLLVISGVMWVAFVAWSWFVTTKRTLPEPIFPWRFIKSRVCIGLVLNTFFTGTIITVATIQIPQRFQTVNGDSAFVAGTRLIPFSIMVPMGAVISALIIGKTRIPPIYFLFAGGLLEVAGTAGLCVTPTTWKIWPPQYVFQILAGTGVGFFNGTLTLLVPFIVEKRDLGVGTGAVAQFKVLGGMAILAVVTSVMNRVIRSELERILPTEQVQLLLETTNVIAKFPPEIQEQVRHIFGRGYNLQMKIMIGFGAAQIPSTLLMWTKKPIMVEKK
ncbi:Efflux pump [Lachnellula hyalina]|uniref:Efflux pump n=1 Tax=Lachnellula hyalina TaxID=1316788 RepID=A0A8H8TWY7_9HELO|nr:Efflux pump [Lachnellula hyalina]TVY23362.1 Efflux pump [Lachnellula hyalina]